MDLQELLNKQSKRKETLQKERRDQEIINEFNALSLSSSHNYLINFWGQKSKDFISWDDIKNVFSFIGKIFSKKRVYIPFFISLFVLTHVLIKVIFFSSMSISNFLGGSLVVLLFIAIFFLLAHIPPVDD